VMLVLITEPTWSFGRHMKRGPRTLFALLEKALASPGSATIIQLRRRVREWTIDVGLD
jgi:hypothetical protein